MAWTALRVRADLQDNESSIEMRFSGTKHCEVRMTANNPDLAQRGAPAAVEGATLQRFRELLAKDEFVRTTSAEIDTLEASRKPHAQAIADAQAKLDAIAAARKDPKILQAADLGKKLAELDKQEAAIKGIVSEAAASVKAIDPRLTTLRQHLNQARQTLVGQAIKDGLQAVAAEKAKAQDRVVAAMGKPLDELAEVEARMLALGEGSLATRVLAGA